MKKIITNEKYMLHKKMTRNLRSTRNCYYYYYYVLTFTGNQFI